MSKPTPFVVIRAPDIGPPEIVRFTDTRAEADKLASDTVAARGGFAGVFELAFFWQAHDNALDAPVPLAEGAA